MEFLPEKITQYTEDHTQQESDVLKELNRETHAKVLMPRMLSGHLQGRVLAMISKMIRPKKILEIGTYTGYSAICLSEGLTKDGKLISLEINEEQESRIKHYWEMAGISEKAELLIGSALETIPKLEGPFDLVFIDADKENYSNYYNLVIDKVSEGGFILADNVLWSGKITEDPDSFDKDTKKIDEYNKMVQNDPRVENVLLPIRDGIMIARKL